MDPEQDQPNYFPTQGVQQLQQEPGNPRPYLPAPGPSLNQQAQQHPLTQLLDAMLPFGMADQLDLQRHLAGLTQIQQDHAADHLSDADAQSAVGTIMPRLSQLLQKQQKAQAQKMQQGVQSAMQGAALEEGVNAIHKKSRAENFGKEIASLVDPVSGHRAYFTQDNKGQWSEIKFDHAHTETEHALEPIVPANGDAQSSILGGQRAAGGNRSGGLPADGEGVELPPPVNGSEEPAKYLAGAPQQLQEMKQQAAASGQPLNYQQIGQVMRGPSPDPATFEQTIHSGQYTDRYVGGKQVSTDRPPAGSALGGGGKVDHEAQLKGIYQIAERSVPPLRFGAGPHETLKRQEMVQQAAHSLQYRLALQDEHMRKEQSAIAEHGRQEAARVAEHQRIEVAKKEERLRQEQAAKEEKKFGKPLSALDVAQLYSGHLESLHKAHKEWASNVENIGKEVPAHLNPVNHEALAEKRTQKSITIARRLLGQSENADGGPGSRLPTDQAELLQKLLGGMTAGAPTGAPPATASARPAPRTLSEDEKQQAALNAQDLGLVHPGEAVKKPEKKASSQEERKKREELARRRAEAEARGAIVP